MTILAETNTDTDIAVEVHTEYVPAESLPDENQYVFSYKIRINNLTDKPVKLISRHWIITDANNDVEEIKGKGVVGKQPTIEPGKFFEYCSGAILETPVGSMHGFYHFKDNEGEQLHAPIPAFSLSIPNILH